MGEEGDRLCGMRPPPPGAKRYWPGDWQPIESVPRDGTEFLACNADEYDCIELLAVREWENPEHRFFNLNSGNFSRPDYWSHWQPKPTPPEQNP